MNMNWRQMTSKPLQVLLRGVVILVPLVATLYVVWWLLALGERFVGSVLTLILPEAGFGQYVPGMGLAGAVLLIAAAGLLSCTNAFRRLYRRVDGLLDAIPLLGSIYGGLKDLMDYISHPSDHEAAGKVVSIELYGGQLLGIVTQDQPASIPEGLWPEGQEPVAVYLPMSYQIGGFTIYVPRSKIRDVDIKAEEAMRFALTAGMTSRRSGSSAPLTLEPETEENPQPQARPEQSRHPEDQPGHLQSPL